MAIALVQSKPYSTTGSAASHNVVLDSAPTQGNVLIWTVASDAGIDEPGMQSAGWSIAVGTGNFAGAYCIYKVAGAGESATQTLLMNSSTNAAGELFEYSGLLVANLLDQTAENNPAGNVNSCATGTTGTTDTADELLIAFVAQSAGGGTIRTISGWSNSFVQSSHNVTTGSPVNVAGTTATRIVSATGAYSSTATFAGGQSNNPTGLIATFRAAPEGGGTVSTETLTSSLSVADQSLRFTVRGAVGSEAISTTDQLLTSKQSGRVGDDGISVTDQIASYAIRGRVATDSIALSDEALWWLLRHRLLQDDISTVDELISSLSGITVFTAVLASEILLTDEALPSVYRNRLLQSDFSVLDNAIRWMIRNRAAESEILTDDGVLTQLQRFILLTDAFSVDDSAIGVYVPDQLFSPRIRIGVDQPDIVLGSQN